MLKKIRTILALVFFVGITLLFLDFTGTAHHWLSWMAKIQFLPAVLALNALVIISTLYTPDGILAAGYTGNEVNAAGEAIAKANLAQTAFGSVFGTNFGNIFVAICLLFFAFSTVLSWNMFGRINVIYLFGHKAVTFYQVISLAFIFLGTLASNDLVWELSDMFNQLMVIPNSIALFALTGMVVAGAHKAAH